MKVLDYTLQNWYVVSSQTIKKLENVNISI